MNIKQDCRTERISFLLQISSQGHVSYHFPRDPTPALVILRRLPSLIPLQLINNSTCWPRYVFKCWFRVLLLCLFFFFFLLCPALLSPTKSIFMFARIKYRFLHCSGQKHFFLFKTSNSKKTGLQIMYFKRKRRKRKKKKKEPSIPTSLRLQTGCSDKWNLTQSYLSCPEWLVIKPMRRNLLCLFLMPPCHCTQNAELSIFHQPFSSCII